MIGLAHRARGMVTVITPAGSRLRIPSWMLELKAADPRVLPQALLSASSLLALAELVKTVSLPDGSILKPQSNSRKEESVAAASIARARTEGPNWAAADARVAGHAGAEDGSGNSSGISRPRRTP